MVFAVNIVATTKSDGKIKKVSQSKILTKINFHARNIMKKMFIFSIALIGGIFTTLMVGKDKLTREDTKQILMRRDQIKSLQEENPWWFEGSAMTQSSLINAQFRYIEEI